MKRMLLILFAAGLMAGCAPRDKEQDSNEVAEEANEDKFSAKNEKDAQFIADAVAGNYAEIEMAQLAGMKSNNSEVREVAKLLEDEHTKLLNQLQAIASTKAISIPSDNSDEAQKKIDDLTKEQDVKDFDKKWCKEMVDKHEKTIKTFEDRGENTEDAEIKTLVSEALPHLRMHLDKVKACEEKVKDSK